MSSSITFSLHLAMHFTSSIWSNNTQGAGCKVLERHHRIALSLYLCFTVIDRIVHRFAGRKGEAYQGLVSAFGRYQCCVYLFVACHLDLWTHASIRFDLIQDSCHGNICSSPMTVVVIITRHWSVMIVNWGFEAQSNQAI